MKGDYSRIPFNERKKMQHYRKVYLQQGKVLLDSDLNENTDLLHYQMKTLAKDGLCGSPNIGFRIGRGVPLLPVDDHRYIDYIGEGKGWSVKNGNGTLTIKYFEKFEGKGSLKLENATKETELSFAFQKPVDLSQYRYLRLALITTDANHDPILKLFDGKNQTTITPKEPSTDQNKFSVIKYTFPPDAVLDNITEISLSGFSSDTIYHIGAVECSPPMFTLELMTHLEGWSFEPAGSANVSIVNINGGGIIATQTEKLYKKHFSTVDFSKFETIEFTIKSSSKSKSAIKFYITDKDGNVSYWKIKLSKKLKKYSIILSDGKDSDTPAELAFIKEYGFRELSDKDTYHFGSILYEKSLKNNFVISGTEPLSGETGRLYVDGELYEKEEAETYLNQKDYPYAPSITNGERTDLVYVDVWQRHVTSAEDPELREVAVGVDTCNRMKAVAQVKVLKGLEEKPSLPDDLKPTGGGRLSTVVEYMEVEKPCEITSGVEYTGAENRLYRVEIHTGGDVGTASGDVGTATYKWSKDNASTVSQIIENVKGNATSVKVKDVKLFKKGDVIEITDDRVELADRKYISKKSSIKPWGELRRIISIDRDKNELEWADASKASGDPLPMTGGLPHDYIAEGVETTHPRVIKWDGAKETSSKEKLEDGIKIRFSGSDMLPGDYWSFTARENTRAVEKLDNEPPQGVVHYYYPLATIKWDKYGEIINITDLRTRFEPLCGLTAADLAFDNANTQKMFTNTKNVQEALEILDFPNASGIKLENNICDFLYGDADNVQAALDHLCYGITVPSLTLKCDDIAQKRWPKLKCSDSGDISFLAGAKSEDRMRICADGKVSIGTTDSKAKLEVAGEVRVLFDVFDGLCFDNSWNPNPSYRGIEFKTRATLLTPAWGNSSISIHSAEGKTALVTDGPIMSSGAYFADKVGIGAQSPVHELQIGDGNGNDAVAMSLRGPDSKEMSSYLAFEDSKGTVQRWFKLIHDSENHILKLASDRMDPIMTFERKTGNVNLNGVLRLKGIQLTEYEEGSVNGCSTQTYWINAYGKKALGFKEVFKNDNYSYHVVTGTSWSKDFLINHPLNPEHKYLIHSTLEGPEIAVFYRGEAELAAGEATVRLPDYFEALTRKENRTVLLTPKFDKKATVSMLAASEVKDGEFTVSGTDKKNLSQKFYWEVKAVRADVETLEVEETKTAASEGVST